MKKFFVMAVLILLQSLSSAATAQQKKVELTDKVGVNQFVWVSEAPLENIEGSSDGVEGTLMIDSKDIAKTRGTISSKVATMKTGNETRDGHVKSARWLNAAKFPEITFEIKSISGIKQAGPTYTGVATGDFSMHGVTKSMTIPFKIIYLPESAKTRARASGDLVMISADFDLSLKDFNIEGSKGIVGSKVGETIKITAHLFGHTY